ncbi:hypothetical protein C380_13970 [Acidovorax sp. KKS102]|uniref:hypothetical protein n=1 Tax=Acidovorax sp. KKS102 TaxID=358220 RepID=UPI00028AF50C|nr:hypothetical protein [Acidovorax sp. KKS102]AFU46493.1 hypothetical protein C380_13970 [Acidovorax sp. KKS102]
MNAIQIPEKPITLVQAAHLLAGTVSPDSPDAVRKSLNFILARAHSGEVRGRDPDTWVPFDTAGIPPDVYARRLVLLPDDLRRLASECGLPVTIDNVVIPLLAGHTASVSHTDPPQAAPAAPAPEKCSTPAAEGASSAPLALTTGDIAFSFDGMRWNEKEWRKPLGDKPKWLQSCVVIPGQRGVRETRWNPVLIAAALVHNGHVPIRQVRARFQTRPLLLPWLDVWKTYEADNFETQ